MIQVLHFPELEKEIQAIGKAELPLMKIVGEQKIARMRNLVVWTQTYNQQPYFDAYQLYWNALCATTVKCRGLLD